MGICDVPVISTVCNVAGEAAGALVSAPFDWLAQAIGAAAAWMFEGVWTIFDTTTRVDVTSGSYVAVYNILFGVAVFIMLVFFCLQLITGLIRREPRALTHAAVGLAKSVLGSFVVITITAALLEIVDQLCIGIVQATGTSMEEMGHKIGALAAGLTAINIAAPGVGAIITIFLAGLAISAAAIVWFTLLVRKALLLVAIVMAPIALSGFSWDATRGWFTKWAAFVLALAFSKLVIVVVFLVAIAQVSAPIDFDLASIADPVAGVVLMLVAAFAPYITYKFISFAGIDMYHAMSTEQEAKQALNRPVPTPGTAPTASPDKVLTDSTTTGSDDAEPAKNVPSRASTSSGTDNGGGTTFNASESADGGLPTAAATSGPAGGPADGSSHGGTRSDEGGTAAPTTSDEASADSPGSAGENGSAAGMTAGASGAAAAGSRAGQATGQAADTQADAAASTPNADSSTATTDPGAAQPSTPPDHPPKTQSASTGTNASGAPGAGDNMRAAATSSEPVVPASPPAPRAEPTPGVIEPSDDPPEPDDQPRPHP